jgi:hypothetical protein
MLGAAFGPNWSDVIAVIRQTATLTNETALALAAKNGSCHDFTGLPYQHEWKIEKFSAEQSIWAQRGIRAVRTSVMDLVSKGVLGYGRQTMALVAARAMVTVASAGPGMIDRATGAGTGSYVTGVWRRAFPEWGDR